MVNANEIYLSEGLPCNEKVDSMVKTLNKSLPLQNIELYELRKEHQKEFDFDISSYKYIVYDGHHRIAAYVKTNKSVQCTILK